MVKKENTSSKDILLVEFKAPKELVELFDQKSRALFSSRSEALRSLMRAFLEEASDSQKRKADM